MSWLHVIIAIAMGLLWVLALAMFAMTYYSSWKSLRAEPDERVPSGFPVVSGLFGAWMTFATLKIAAHLKYDVPGGWLWVLLPIMLDVPGLLLLRKLSGKGRRD